MKKAFVLCGAILCAASAQTFAAAPMFEEVWDFSDWVYPAYNKNTHLFGQAISLSGNKLVVGRPGVEVGADDAPDGKVSIYTIANNNTWNDDPAQVLELNWNDLNVGPAYFGAALDLKGAQLIVGAPGDVRLSDNAGAYQGAAFIYENFGNKAKVLPRNVPAGKHAKFGAAVAIDGEFAVVGAPGEEAAYIYRKVNGVWAPAPIRNRANGKIAGGEAGSGYGRSVAIHGYNIIVGAPAGGGGRGVAYLYKWSIANNRWEEQATLWAPGAAGGQFGCSVAIDDDCTGLRAVVGAKGENNNSGRAYVYDCGGAAWDVENPHRLNPNQVIANQNFGDSVDMSGYKIIVGALGGAGATGKTYIFSRAYAATGEIYYNNNAQGGSYAAAIHDVAIDRELAASAQAATRAAGNNDENLGRVAAMKLDFHEVYFGSNVANSASSAFTWNSVKMGTPFTYSCEAIWDARVPAASRKFDVNVWDIRGMTSIPAAWHPVSGANGVNPAMGEHTFNMPAGDMPVRFVIGNMPALPAGVPGPEITIHANYTLWHCAP